MKRSFSYGLFFLLFALPASYAKTPIFDNQPSWAERSHHKVNLSLQATANWLDHFFADDRFEEEQAWTRLKLQWTMNAAETEDFESDIRLRGKVVLPNLKRRWQLVFEGDPSEDDLTGLNKDQESTTSIRFIAQENLKSRLSFDAGIRGGFTNPRFRTNVQYRIQKETDRWLHRFRPVIEYDTQDEWQAFIQIDNERKFGDDLFFRSSTIPRWRDNTDGYLLSQDFTLFKKLSDRRYVAFDWANSFSTKPHGKLDAVLLRVRFRREIWQDKLFLEIGPGVRFLAEDHHKPEAAGFLRLEMLFEKRPDPVTHIPDNLDTESKDTMVDSAKNTEEDDNPGNRTDRYEDLLNDSYY